MGVWIVRVHFFRCVVVSGGLYASGATFSFQLGFGGLFFLAGALFLSFEECLIACDKAPPKYGILSYL